ncbi:MAG TPA: exosortase A [Telluria sp.]|nr:exosortase A [Telluria sp.]
MSAILAVQPRVSSLRGAVIALALLLPVLVYFATAESIVAIWTRSETFAHGYVIVPISLWLAWQRRDTLRQMPATPFWPALLLLLGCGFAWLLADLGDVQIVKQYAFVAMLPLTVLAMLGTRIARTIAFALLFLLFAVPFGEIFIPRLMDVTADFTISALRATGIPVLREGNTFSIPTGTWSVVEACSGLRYLIASFTLGTLYAYLTFRSLKRRALFVLLAIIVPIFANSGRAYMIVMMGHLSGMTMAVGFDHLIYGWLFFGVVMFLLFWLGSLWREDSPAAEGAAAAPRVAAGAPASTARLLAMALGVAACIGIWPLYSALLAKSERSAVVASVPAIKATWQDSGAFTDWAPAFSPPQAKRQQFFQQGAAKVGVTLLYYRNQNADSRLISSTNNLVTGEKNNRWHSFDATLRSETLGARLLKVREEKLAGPSGRMLVWHWYWIDGDATASDYAGKALQVKQKFLHGSDDGAAVLVSAPYDDNPDQARAAMREFLAANLPAVEAALAANPRH